MAITKIAHTIFRVLLEGQKQKQKQKKTYMLNEWQLCKNT